MTMNPYDPNNPDLPGGERPPQEPAPATTPLTPTPEPDYGPIYGSAYGQPSQEPPTTPGAGANWASPYLANQQPLPSYAPYGAPSVEGSGGAPRRGSGWRGALLAAALLVALLIGGGLGALITNALAAHGAAGGGTPVVIGGSAPGVTISSSVASLEQNLQSVAAAVEPSIVKITSVSSREEATGSGDILTSDGYIVTNDHVVAGFNSYTVLLPNGASYSARLVGQDAQDDLAVLKIAATGLKPVAIADSSITQTGSFAIAIGYPLGGQESATFGVVSGLNRALSEAPDGPAGELAGLIQTSAQLNPGNSGGALVNLQGQLIGIPTLEASNPETRSSANGVGYAISANRMGYVVKQLIASGKLTTSGQGFLGIETQDANGQGVQVAGFTNDASGASPARKAGLQQGDIITAVSGKSVTGGDDVAALVLTAAPGTAITVTVLRSSGSVTLPVTLGERPVSG